MADPPSPAQPGKPTKGRAEKVTAIEQIAETFPAIPGPKPKTYLEWSGTIQMTILLGVICVICGAMLWLWWWWNRPTLRDLPAVLAAGGVPATQPLAPKDAIDLADRLQTSHTAQFTSIFQTVVLSVLVPLFTLIAGYVFGRAKSEEK